MAVKGTVLKIKLFTLIVMLFFVFCACNTLKEPEPFSKDIYALDTFINLKIYGDNPEVVTEIAEQEIYRLEGLFSVTDKNSEVYRINTESGDIPVSKDTTEIIDLAAEISQKTDGALDITVYPLVKLWGFTTDENYVPTESEIEEKLRLVDYHKINVNADASCVSVEENMQIDLGAVAKGYIAWEISDLLKSNGVDSAILAFGGNIQTIGTKNGESWRVGVRYPDTNDNFAVLNVGETAIVTSAADQRFFEQDGVVYHHIIDPKTGKPAQSGVKSATVICSNGAVADGLSTALFVMGVENAINLYKNNGGFDFIILTDDDKLYLTDGIKDSFEPTELYKNIEIVNISR